MGAIINSLNHKLAVHANVGDFVISGDLEADTQSLKKKKKSRRKRARRRPPPNLLQWWRRRQQRLPSRLQIRRRLRPPRLSQSPRRLPSPQHLRMLRQRGVLTARGRRAYQ